jgi:hypothetical protein
MKCAHGNLAAYGLGYCLPYPMHQSRHPYVDYNIPMNLSLPSIITISAQRNHYHQKLIYRFMVSLFTVLLFISLAVLLC